MLLELEQKEDYKKNEMKAKYTKRQIIESIKYWQRQLKTMNESNQEDENFEKRSAYYAKKHAQDIYLTKNDVFCLNINAFSENSCK